MIQQSVLIVKHYYQNSGSLLSRLRNNVLSSSTVKRREFVVVQTKTSLQFTRMWPRIQGSWFVIVDENWAF